MSRKPSTLLTALPLSLLIPSVAFAQAPEEAPEEPAAEEAPAEEEAAEEPAAEEAAPEPEPAEEPAEEPPVEEEAPAEEPAEEPEAEEAPAEPAPEPIKEEAEAPAPSLLPLKVGVHTFSRFEYRDNYNELGVSRARFQEGDQTVFRSRISFQTNPMDLGNGITGHVYVAPQASGSWGTHGIGGTIGEADGGIYEGYFMFKGKVLEGKAGRFAMNYGTAAVIGNLDWHQSGRAFDGAHFRVKAGKANVDIFATQQAEGGPVQGDLNKDLFEGDAYFWGVYSQIGAAIMEGLDLDVYALGKSIGAADLTDDTGAVTHRDGATFMTLGARAKQKLGIIDYNVEGGFQTGKTPGVTEALDKTAYQVHGEVGVSPFEKLRISLGGAVASGDDAETTDNNEAYDELYPTTHKFLGLMDVIGFRTNILSANANVVAKLTGSTIFKLHAHLFSRMEENGLGRSADATSDFAGTEINAHLIQKIGKPGYARALYGVFLANEDHYGSDVTAHYTEVQAGFKF